jgi:hypothetical protein
MSEEIDRSDPAVRASLALRDFERTQRARRIIAALVLIALAVGGPFAAAPLTGRPGATFGAIVAAVLFAGSAVVIWPWAWSDAEREHHTNAAIWAQARPDTEAEAAWDRWAAWARADGDWVRLVLIRCAGTTGDDAAPSPFTVDVCETFDADAVLEATEAMERLRAEAARREADARERHERALTAAARKPYDDALREVDQNASRRTAPRRDRDASRDRRARGRRTPRAGIRRRTRPTAPVTFCTRFAERRIRLAAALTGVADLDRAAEPIRPAGSHFG